MAGGAPLQWRVLVRSERRSRHWSGAPPARSSHARFLALIERHLLHGVEVGAAPGDLLGAHALDVVVVELPLAILVPAQGRLHRGARPRRALQHLEREAEREALAVGLVR